MGVTPAPESSKIQTPTINLEQESKKSALEILKIKRKQAEKQKMPKYTIKSIDKAALKEYDLKSALYQTMYKNKSFNRNPANHALYHVLKEALIVDENVMDKGVTDTVKDHKRKHDDDEDTPAGPNQGKKTKRIRTKESESSKKPSTTKETPKGKAPSIGSKTGKYASVKEPVKEPIDEVVMDDAVNTTSEDVFKEGEFVDLYLNEIEDMLLLAVQHKLFHLNDSDIIDFIVALRLYTPSPDIELKELYTPSYNPPRVIYEDLNKQKRVMRDDELYKFSDGTLKKVWDELHHIVIDFCLGYNNEMSRRKWTAIDRKRSQLMFELIDKQMRERRIIQNLERLVGARELEMDYKLMTRTI
ncbi:hypothetical protein Tco_0967807 [Tanacetum coccineum]